MKFTRYTHMVNRTRCSDLTIHCFNHSTTRPQFPAYLGTGYPIVRNTADGCPTWRLLDMSESFSWIRIQGTKFVNIIVGFKKDLHQLRYSFHINLTCRVTIYKWYDIVEADYVKLLWAAMGVVFVIPAWGVCTWSHPWRVNPSRYWCREQI